MKRIFLLFAFALASLGIVMQPTLAAKAKDPVKVSQAKAIQGTQQVAIGQFTVAFLIERKDNAKAGGGLMGSGFGGRSTVRSQLAGVEPAQMQAVADAAYEDFVAKLQAQGFSVADRAPLAQTLDAHKTAEQFVEKTVLVGKDDKARARMVGASQTGPLRFLFGDYFMSGFGDIGTQQSAFKIQTAMQEYAKGTGVNVINVVYVVNFASSDEYGGWFRNTSSVKVNGGLGVAPDVSRVTVVGAKRSPGTLTLTEPVAIGGDFFAQEDAMGGGEKAVRAVTKVVGLLGGIGSNSYKKFTFTALPGAYPEGATQAVGEASALFTARLASLR